MSKVTYNIFEIDEQGQAIEYRGKPKAIVEEMMELIHDRVVCQATHEDTVKMLVDLLNKTGYKYAWRVDSNE